MISRSVSLSLFFICSIMNDSFAFHCEKELRNHEKYVLTNFAMNLCVNKSPFDINCSIRRIGPTAPERARLFITTTNPQREYWVPILVSDDIKVLNNHGKIGLRFDINDYDMAPLAITCDW
jgi:hypothetical protein